MEQTTEGTISYLLSISWSHLSPTSAKPNSWLVEVMVDKVEATGSKGEKKVGGRDGGGLKEFLDQWASPTETCLRNATYWRVFPLSFYIQKGGSM